MKSVTLHSGQFLIVEVPEGAKGVAINNMTDVVDFSVDGMYGFIPLPPGQYELIGKGDEIGEEVAKGIVPKEDSDRGWTPTYYDPDSGGHGFCYDDYENPYKMQACYYTATASLASLIKSHGMKPETTLIIRKSSQP